MTDEPTPALWQNAHRAILAGQSPAIPGVQPSTEFVYHPDPIINAEVIEQTIEAERFDVATGSAPRSWTCPCGTTHSRGHFLTIGTHRCLSCGYVGTEGIMHGAHHVLPSGPPS